MVKYILGKKIGMSQIFKEEKVIPVTKIQAGPCLITQVKTSDKEGYSAIQIAFDKKRKINKPLLGHLKKIQGEKEHNRYLREFRTGIDNLKAGDKITVDIFQPGDKVKVSGISKGKGFQGVVKRHGFHGSPATHGHKDQLRMPGSIGAGGVDRVFKGQKMAGHMGAERATIKNLEIIEIDSATNTILIKGAVPGIKNSLLEIVQE
jgi:large subunit ribosomal protein L3